MLIWGICSSELLFNLLQATFTLVYGAKMNLVYGTARAMDIISWTREMQLTYLSPCPLPAGLEFKNSFGNEYSALAANTCCGQRECIVGTGEIFTQIGKVLQYQLPLSIRFKYTAKIQHTMFKIKVKTTSLQQIFHLALTFLSVLLSMWRYDGVRTSTGSLPSTVMFTNSKKVATFVTQLNCYSKKGTFNDHNMHILVSLLLNRDQKHCSSSFYCIFYQCLVGQHR